MQAMSIMVSTDVVVLVGDEVDAVLADIVARRKWAVLRIAPRGEVLRHLRLVQPHAALVQVSVSYGFQSSLPLIRALHERCTALALFVWTPGYDSQVEHAVRQCGIHGYGACAKGLRDFETFLDGIKPRGSPTQAHGPPNRNPFPKVQQPYATEQSKLQRSAGEHNKEIRS